MKVSGDQFSVNEQPITYWTRLRCLVFWLTWSALTLVMATVLFFLFWMPAHWSYRYTWYWNYFSLKLFIHLLGIRYRVIGREKLTDQPASIVVANHEAEWETQALTVILPPLTWVIKYELVFIPFFGQVIFLMRPIMIKRQRKRESLLKILDEGKRALRAGRWVAIFPQGTRQPNVLKPRFHASPAALAVSSGCSLIPIVHNSSRCWGKGLFNKRPGMVTIVIGEPIPAVDQDGRPRRQRDIHLQMTETLHRMRADLEVTPPDQSRRPERSGRI